MSRVFASFIDELESRCKDNWDEWSQNLYDDLVFPDNGIDIKQ